MTHHVNHCLTNILTSTVKFIVFPLQSAGKIPQIWIAPALLPYSSNPASKPRLQREPSEMPLHSMVRPLKVHGLQLQWSPPGRSSNLSRFSVSMTANSNFFSFLKAPTTPLVPTLCPFQRIAYLWLHKKNHQTEAGQATYKLMCIDTLACLLPPGTMEVCFCLLGSKIH